MTTARDYARAVNPNHPANVKADAHLTVRFVCAILPIKEGDIELT